MEAIIGSGFIVVIVIVAIMLFLHFVPIGLWISALASNVHVGIFTLVGMRMRRVPPQKIVLPLIKANKAGLSVNVNQLEAHYLAGGNVDKVVDALIAAHRAQIPLPFERSAAIDLAGRDVLEAVQMSVNPKVIETPVVSAVARNGIELKIKARVTVRANIADTFIVDKEFMGCNVGRGIVPIRTQEDIMRLEFLKCLIDNKHLNDILKSKAKGITLIQLNMEDLSPTFNSFLVLQ